MYLQATWPQQRIINEIFAVRHAYEENVVEGIHPVDLRQQLIDDAVMNASAVGFRSPRLADGVDLVEDHHMQLRILALLLLLLLCVCEEVADVLLCRPHPFHREPGAHEDADTH